MKAVARFSLVGAVALVMLAGCGRGFFEGSRAPWRHQAEVQCMQSGAVKIGGADVQLDPIEGPGVCGMDFPLKVSALGEPPALSYSDDLRPPASIPQSRMPQWPVRDEYYSAQPVPPRELPEAQVAPHQRLRWVTGPRAVNAPANDTATGGPMSIAPQGSGQTGQASTSDAYQPPARAAARPWVSPDDAPAASRPDDIPPDAILPGGKHAERQRTRTAYNAPDYQPPWRPSLPALGPMRGPYSPASIPQATLKPAAKLACPIVSALDRWVSAGVQPAALHWFHQPVVEIHQIGSYACRDMVGASSEHISEHAFGNALDISGFTLADGRTITVKDGWHGTADEQAFLHDVQLYACETFTTVLAPGYNPEHYNHIHVDLMKRRPGYRPCRPTAIRGDIVAARVRAHYANRDRGPAYTGSIGKRDAVAGADGLEDDGSSDDGRPAPDGPKLSGSIPRWLRTPPQNAFGTKGSHSQIY